MRSMLALSVATVLLAGQAATGAQTSPQADPGPVDVPRGDGAPVVTDGTFTPGEWDDARRIAVNDDLTLHVKEHRGVVFVGVRGRSGIGPSELSLAAPDGPILKLHVSYALYEVVLPAAGEEPRPRMGFTRDWYANEIRRDEDALARLRAEGKPPWAADYPSDGLEFAVRRSKLPGPVWRVRLSASGLFGGKPGMIVHPPAAAERDTARWLELRLN